MKKRPTRALEVVRRAAAGQRAPAKKKRATRSPARRKSHTPRKPQTVEQTLAIVDSLIADLPDDLPDLPELKPRGKSRYGLPKATIHNFFDPKPFGPTAVRWFRIMNRYDEQLEDAYNAFEAGLLTRQDLEKRSKSIGEKFRAARDNLDDAVRVGARDLKPRVPVKRKTPRHRGRKR